MQSSKQSPNSKLNVLMDLKGQSNEIFDPHFFSSFEPVWATDQWVKIFLFWFRFCRDIYIFPEFQFSSLENFSSLYNLDPFFCCLYRDCHEKCCLQQVHDKLTSNSNQKWLKISNLEWPQPNDNIMTNSLQTHTKTQINLLKICPQVLLAKYS